MESPGTYVTECVSRGHFCSAFRTALPCYVGYHLERGVMALHYAVEINCKKGATILKIKGQMSSIWAKGSMLMIVCVLSDLT